LETEDLRPLQGYVSVCPQGHVSLQFGAASIHLSLEEFRSFVAAASESLNRLERVFRGDPEVRAGISH
jgi:hypothetical protein